MTYHDIILDDVVSENRTLSEIEESEEHCLVDSYHVLIVNYLSPYFFSTVNEWFSCFIMFVMYLEIMMIMTCHSCFIRLTISEIQVRTVPGWC